MKKSDVVIALIAGLLFGVSLFNLYRNNHLDYYLSRYGLNHAPCGETIRVGKLCGNNLALYCLNQQNLDDIARALRAIDPVPPDLIGPESPNVTVLPNSFASVLPLVWNEAYGAACKVYY